MSETARQVIVDVVRGGGDADAIIATLADAGFVIVPKTMSDKMIDVLDTYMPGPTTIDACEQAKEAWAKTLTAATNQPWRPGQ